jgi:hypothetical protein
VAILGDVDAWQETYPDCAAENGDVNGDGALNFDDIDPFVAALSG